ncbi:ketopantoate reductase family protein [Desulfarculus baarsii]
MHVAVVGPGAMGLLFACRLSQAGAAVTLIDHRPERAARVAAQGVTIEDETGQSTLAIDITADPAALAKADLALVCVKAHGTAQVAATLAKHLDARARALTFQNGAGNVEALTQALGPERVLGGITSEGATVLGPGRVRHAGRGQTHIGPAEGPPDAYCGQAADLLARAGFAVSQVEGVQNLIWTKLIINVGINALTAILDAPNGRLLELPSARRLMDLAVDEALGVGLAYGVRFLHQDMPQAVRDVARRTAKNVSSMRADVQNKRPTEVEFINGAVCRMGQEKGLATPINQTLTLLVKAIEENQQPA